MIAEHGLPVMTGMGGKRTFGADAAKGCRSTFRSSALEDPIEVALRDARRYRNEGRAADAEQAYYRAADLARENGNQLALAHALRHMSDLARQRAGLVDAWAYASEAASLYRQSDDRLGLANAMRLQALSATGNEEAKHCWREARDLYLALGVITGVDECDSHLRT